MAGGEWKIATPLSGQSRAEFRFSTATARMWISPWERATPVVWRRFRRIIYRPPPPVDPPGGFSPDNPIQPIITPGAYIVLNEFSVVRLPDRAPVECTSVRISTDRASWCRSFSISLSGAEEIAKITPVTGDPVAVEITLNGYVWTATIEGVTESRQFGEVGFTVDGRSRSCVLQAPYFPPRSYTEMQVRTAANLIDHELEFTGWTWSAHASIQQLLAIDWLIQPGAHTYANSTPIDALSQIAEGIGARLSTDRVGSALRFAPKYPSNFWAWNAEVPGKSLVMDNMKSAPSRYSANPDYNRVIVSGQQQGIIKPVRRMGSAGDVAMPMVVHPLISCDAAAIERGRNELNTAGKQALVEIEAVLDGNVGLLEIGDLVAVADVAGAWRGLCVGVEIDATFGECIQRIELERHY